MLATFFGIFILLHGLVHLLYFGQSARYFEMQQGMVWPDGSWAFSRLFGEIGSRNLASALLVDDNDIKNLGTIFWKSS